MATCSSANVVSTAILPRDGHDKPLSTLRWSTRQYMTIRISTGSRHSPPRVRLIQRNASVGGYVGGGMDSPL